MRRFFARFFSTQPRHPSARHACHGAARSDPDIHAGFKTRRGEGPFLLSCDGRVIPLRKARFLNERH
jgi:hypothetical protein